MTTGKEKHRIEGTLFDTCFSDDGKWLISGYKENTGTVWDVKTGKQIRTFGGHKKPVTYCSFSSDKKRLVTYDESDTIRVWDAATAKELRAFKVRGWPDSLWHQVQFRMRMSRNAKMMVTWTPTHLRLWDLTTGKTIRSMERLLKL